MCPQRTLMPPTPTDPPAYSVQIYAHRGLWVGHYPENSIEAFRAARRFGFPSECDIWQTADGQPVVIHDATLDRTTTGSGPVHQFTEADLREVHGRMEGMPAQFLPIPMLKDVADWVSLVEVKPPNAQELIEHTIRTMAGRKWTLQSFDPANLRHALEEDPRLPVTLLVEDADGIETAISERWNVNVDHKLLDDRIAGRLTDAGLDFGVWTVNTEDELLRILPWRPSAVISDQPQLIRSILVRSGIACA